DVAPSDLSLVSMQVTHPDFPKDQPRSEPKAAELRRGMYTVQLHHHVGRSLDGVVLDPDGRAVRGAKIVIASDRYESSKPTATSDRDAHFKWREAPADAIQFDVSKEDMASIQGAEVKAGGDRIRLTIYPPVKSSGKVIDAETGEPVTAFQVVYGIRWMGQQDV